MDMDDLNKMDGYWNDHDGLILDTTSSFRMNE